MKTTLGILGAGSVGRALAALLREAGYRPVLGVRNPQAAAAKLGADVDVRTPQAAVDAAGIIINATPWAGESGSATLDLLRGLRGLDGKILVDATNPLNADWSPRPPGPDTSAGEETQRAVPGAFVVKAFNTVFADMMDGARLRHARVPVTAFFCGDAAQAKGTVGGLLGELGFHPLDAGPLSSARYLEAIAHLNIRLAVGMGGGTHAYFTYEQRKA
jgi:hypothetical protein